MGSPKVDVSVVVCAYTMDRWNDLNAAIESIRRQSVAPRDTTIVVDHNPDLLERAKQKFPDARVVSNRGGKGLSEARNTGIAASSGSLLTFLDDDAVADVEWLAQLVACCAPTDVLGAASWIEPLWAAAKPAWFPEEFLWVVGCSYRGLPTVRAEVRNVLGAGMAVKRSVFDKAGGFSGMIGRYGGSFPLSCDETELCIRARSTMPQGRFMQEPASIVAHRIPATRTTLGYFCLRSYAEGLSKAYVLSMVSASGTLATERSYVLRTLTNGFARGLADGALRLDLSGFGRSAAIALGLACASIGYIVGTFWTLSNRHRRRRSSSFSGRGNQ